MILKDNSMKKAIVSELKNKFISDNRFISNIENLKVKKFYKYRDLNEYSLKDLINNTVTLTNPKKFNDLYDSATIKSSYSEMIDENKESIRISNSAVGLDQTKKTYGPILNSFKKDKTYFEEQDIFHMRYFHDYLRVLSLTESNDNILMWSHYANSNQGICIEYELISDKLVNNLFPVIYIKKPIDLTNLISNNFSDKELKLYIYLSTILKHDIWKYEEEWRFFILFDDNVNNDFLDIKINQIFKVSKIYLGRDFLRYWDDNRNNPIYSEFTNWIIENHIDLYIMKNKFNSFHLIPEKLSYTDLMNPSTIYCI